MKNTTKGKLIKGAAVLVDVAVPLGVTFSQFPVWVEESAEATMSGLFLIFALLSCLPFLKQIKEFFKSPSVWVLWIILFAILTALRSIIDQMIFVCFWGMVANIIGAGIYKLGGIVEALPPKEEVEKNEQN